MTHTGMSISEGSFQFEVTKTIVVVSTSQYWRQLVFCQSHFGENDWRSQNQRAIFAHKIAVSAFHVVVIEQFTRVQILGHRYIALSLLPLLLFSDSFEMRPGGITINTVDVPPVPLCNDNPGSSGA